MEYTFDVKPLSTRHEEISPASLTTGGRTEGRVCLACGLDPAIYQPDSCNCSFSYCKKCAMKCASGGKCKKCSAFYSGFIHSVENSTADIENVSSSASAVSDISPTPSKSMCVVCRVGEAIYQPDSCDCSFSYCKKCAMKCATGGKCQTCKTFYSGFVNNLN